MSTENASLSDFVTQPEEDTPPEEDSSVRPNWTPHASSEDTNRSCQNCGSHVTEQFARVFGTNDDAVHGCPDCSTGRELYEGHGAHAEDGGVA